MTFGIAGVVFPAKPCGTFAIYGRLVKGGVNRKS